jgi:PEP-CTERM motif
MKKILFVLAFAAVLGASRPASADLIVNGSFETGDFTGWTVNAGATGVVTAGFDGLVPEDGTFFAALGNVGGLGTLSQTFNTTAGATYELSYWLSSDGATPNEFATQIDGVTVIDQVNIPQTGYINYIFDFVSAGPTSTVTFFERNDPAYLGFDNISVNGRSVPEPSAIALFGVGAIGLVAALRKRRKATV